MSASARGLVVLVGVDRFADRRECLEARTVTQAIALLHTVRPKRIEELWLGDEAADLVQLLEDLAAWGVRWDIGIVKLYADAPSYRTRLAAAGYVAEEVADVSVLRRRLPNPPPWDQDAAAGQEAIFEAMGGEPRGLSGMRRWGVMSGRWNIAGRVAQLRSDERTAWCLEHGWEPELWPVAHPPLVLRVPHLWFSACVRCEWVGSGSSGRGGAVKAAERHSRAAEMSVVPGKLVSEGGSS